MLNRHWYIAPRRIKILADNAIFLSEINYRHFVWGTPTLHKKLNYGLHRKRNKNNIKHDVLFCPRDYYKQANIIKLTSMYHYPTENSCGIH